MAKQKKFYTVCIKRTEIYSGRVLVEATSAAEAKRKVEEDWDKDDYLYSKITDIADDARTTFCVAKPITPDNLQSEKAKCLTID